MRTHTMRIKYSMEFTVLWYLWDDGHIKIEDGHLYYNDIAVSNRHSIKRVLYQLFR